MEFFFSNNIKNNLITLDKVETNHCMNVLRYSLNDEIKIVDGEGNLYIGNILSINNNECSVKISKTINNYNNKDFYVHLAISPTKNHNRIEWFVEKAIEIGVDEISFINCSRTVRKNIRMNRINKIAKTAIKQANKAKLPRINSLIDFKNFVLKENENSFICHLNKKIKKNFFSYKHDFLKTSKSCILIGPEGDFSEKEIDLALKYKIAEVTLGKSVLRTETAGVIACSLVNVINEML